MAGVELGKDEAAYWYWSQHLDATYAALPLAAVALADAILPGHEWLLRLPSALAGLLSLALVHSLCREWGLSLRRCKWATAAFAASHWIWHTSSYLHPDGYLVPCWLLALWCAQRATQSHGDRWWAGAGIAAGLATLSKYSGGVLAAGMLAALLMDGRPGRWRRLTTFALAAFLVASPLVVAQWRTGFFLPTTLGTLSRIAADAAAPSRLLHLLSSPLFFVSPLLLLLLYFGLGQHVRRAWQSRALSDLALTVPGVLLLGTFAFFALVHGQVKGNWILPAFLGVWPLTFSLAPSGVGWRRWYVPVLVVVGGLQTLGIALSLKYPQLPAQAGAWLGDDADATYPRLVSPADQVREPSATWTERVCEYHGWRELVPRLEAALGAHDVPRSTPIVSTQYAIPFGVAYYSPGRPVHTLDDPRFRFLADLTPTDSQKLPSVVFISRGSIPPGWLPRTHPHTQHLGTLSRTSPGCGEETYRITLYTRDQGPMHGRKRISAPD
ncbi:glycosyltransferase family 39 protein [Candidatus Latescibacterota bacterium]